MRHSAILAYTVVSVPHCGLLNRSNFHHPFLGLQLMLASVQFTPQKSDLIWSGYAGVRARPFIFVTAVSFFVVLPWLAALLTIVLALMGKFVGWQPIAIFVLVPPISVTFFALLPLFLFRNARSLRGTHNYEFTRDGMHFTGPGFDNRVEWSLVTRCLYSRAGLLFMSDSLPMVNIPKRILSPEVSGQISELLRANNIPVVNA